MARKVTFEFKANLTLVRAVEHLLAAHQTDHELTIRKTNGKTVRRKFAYVRKVRVRRMRAFSGIEQVWPGEVAVKMAMRRGDRVTEMYAFLTIDPVDDCEGIPSFSLPSPEDPKLVMMMPLVAADKDRVGSMRRMALHLARLGHCKMRLVRFRDIETLEEFGWSNVRRVNRNNKEA